MKLVMQKNMDHKYWTTKLVGGDLDRTRLHMAPEVSNFAGEHHENIDLEMTFEETHVPVRIKLKFVDPGGTRSSK